MPGFAFYYNTSATVVRNDKLICEQLQGSDFQINRFTNNKFLADKLFVEDERGILVLDGVILNKLDLMKRYGSDWKAAVWKMYTENEDHFYKVFRGPFSGLLYDRSKNKWIIFTDHIGLKPLFYYMHDQVLVVSSEMARIYDYLKENGITAKLNTNAAFMLLSYGYMLDDNTLCTGIKKLLAGNCMIIEKSVKIEQYYHLPKSSVNENNVNEDEYIEGIDQHFRRAIALQFEKDKEYGYTHFVSLSGGLDSRMVCWVAHEMGYTNQINYTFSQTDYLDETTPKKIAADLKHQWIFKALDNGLFLHDIDEITKITGGNILFFGLAHSGSIYKLINFDHMGIVHSGQLGEAILGTFVKNFNTKYLEQYGYAYSDTFTNKVQTPPVHFADFAELEQSLLYQRGFNATNAGNMSEQQYSENIAPFYDVDFFEYCLNIPINVRMGHSIYKKWVIKKYPKAGMYVWETTRQRINGKDYYLKIGEKKIPLRQLRAAFLRKLGLKKNPSQTTWNMNPLDYWYATNAELKEFMDNYYSSNIHLVNAYPELADVCNKLFNGNAGVERIQVLSLLSAMKMYSLQ